jgi:hydroxypyruvate isomerase
MPKFAASLSWLFQEVPLLQRFQSAADAGFQAVEVQAPYEVSAKALAEQLERHNLTAVLINMQPGLAAIPGSQSEFRKSLDRALAYADTMHCQQLHCLSGITDNPRAEETLVSNLRWASEQASQHGVRLLLEPLNTTDNPGYFLTGTNQARRIIEAVDSPYVAMQFDAYHLQIMEGSLTESLRKHFDIIAHIQIGGVPGRHEPDHRQEINYPYLFDLIDELGFEGWVGCEYAPIPGTNGLDWAQPYGIGTANTRGESTSPPITSNA